MVDFAGPVTYAADYSQLTFIMHSIFHAIDHVQIVSRIMM